MVDAPVPKAPSPKSQKFPLILSGAVTVDISVNWTDSYIQYSELVKLASILFITFTMISSVTKHPYLSVAVTVYVVVTVGETIMFWPDCPSDHVYV